MTAQDKEMLQSLQMAQLAGMAKMPSSEQLKTMLPHHFIDGGSQAAEAAQPHEAQLPTVPAQEAQMQPVPDTAGQAEATEALAE